MSRALLVAFTASIAVAACGASPVESEPITTDQIALSRSRGASPNPGSFAGVDYLGDGCPGGSTTTAISPDGQAVTSTFSAFTAATDDGSGSRGCLMQVRINAAAGWSYRLDSVDHRGFVSLDDGARATRQSVYVVPDNRPLAPAPATFHGEHQDDFNDREVAPETFGWSACGGGQTVLIATRISVGSATGKSGLIALDSTDTVLSWKRCP